MSFYEVFTDLVLILRLDLRHIEELYAVGVLIVDIDSIVGVELVIVQCQSTVRTLSVNLTETSIFIMTHMIDQWSPPSQT